MISLKTHRTFITFLVALFFAPLALAVVTVLDPQGSPVPNQTFSITLPGGEVKEGETDDDGILFWWVDGKRTVVSELPKGTRLGGGYTIEVAGGMSTLMKVGLGVAAAAGAYVIADDNDGNSSSQASEPPMTGTDDPPMTAMGMLSVTPEMLELEREVGDDCPVQVGVISVGNTGDDTLTYDVSPAAADAPRFDYEDQSNSVSADSADMIPVDFTCEDGDVEGTFTQEISFSAGDAGTGSVSVQVRTTAAPMAPGMLTNEGPTEFVKIHVVGSDPCPDPFGTIRITNTGGMAINFNLVGESFTFAETTSGSLGPGESIEISVVFPCEGFSIGSNTGQIVISSTSSEDGSTETGTVTIPVDLTVNN